MNLASASCVLALLEADVIKSAAGARMTADQNTASIDALVHRAQGTEPKEEKRMSGTQKSVGITATHKADYSGFEKPSQAAYNRGHGRPEDAPLSGTTGRATKPILRTGKGKS